MPSASRELSVEGLDATLSFRIVSNLELRNTLTALHGGPGMCSDSMRSLEALAGPELAVVTSVRRQNGRRAPSPVGGVAFSVGTGFIPLRSCQSSTRSPSINDDKSLNLGVYWRHRWYKNGRRE
jgi:hypothetical protein